MRYRYRTSTVILSFIILILIGLADRNTFPESMDKNVSADGLCISISLDKTIFKIGDDFIINVTFQNISDKKLYFYYSSLYPAFNLQIIDEKGEIIKAIYTAMYKIALEDPENLFIELNPGEIKAFELKAKIILSYYLEKGLPTIAFSDVNHQLKRVGKFKIHYNYETNKCIADFSKKTGFEGVWLEKVISNTIEFSISSPQKNELDEKIKLLKSGDQNKKEEAIDFLKANREPRAIPYLIKIIEEENNPLQNRATDAIWMIGDKHFLPELKRVYRLKVKNGCNDDEQIGILDTILRLEDNQNNIQKILIDAIESNPSTNVKRHAIYELGYKSRDKKLENIDFLIRLNTNPEPLIRQAAIETLCRITEYPKPPEDVREKIVQVLINVMKNDSDPGVRYNAIRGLGQIGDISSVPILKEYGEKCEDKYCIEAVKKAMENIEFRESASHY